MTVTIELPGIKAVSRNETTGHYINYKTQLNRAEQWMFTYGKRFEHHFAGLVDVYIDAYYDTRLSPVLITTGKRAGKKTNRWLQAADTPNIDDKIFTDILIRYVNRTVSKIAGKKIVQRTERPVWFLEDDGPKHLRRVIKQSIPSDEYKIIIRIEEV